MQEYTVYLYLQIAVHVSGGISTHRQELISKYLQYLTFMRTLLQPVVDTTGSNNGLNNARYCTQSDFFFSQFHHMFL